MAFLGNVPLGNLSVGVIANLEGLNQLENRIRQLGLRIRIAGSAMTQAFAPVTLGVAAAVREYGNLDDAVTQSMSLMRGVGPEMKSMFVQQAEALSQRLAPSAIEVAESFEYLTLAGFNVAEVLGTSETAMKFATAGHFKARVATDLLTDSMTAMGEGATGNWRETNERMLFFANSIAKASTLANASMEQFGEAIQNRLGAEFRAAGRPLSEVLAGIAALAAQGNKGRRAGQQLSIVMRDLQGKAYENAEAFERFNIAVFDAQGNTRPFTLILEDVDRAFGSLTDSQRQAAVANLGLSAKNLAALQSFIDMSDEAKRFNGELQDVEGEVDRISKGAMSSFNKQMGNLFEVIKSGARVLGQDFAPVVKDIVSILAGLAGKYKSLSADSKRFFINSVLVVGILGPLISSLGLLVVASSVVVAPLKLVAGALRLGGKAGKFFLSKNGLILGLLLALTAGIAYLLNEMTKASKTTDSFYGAFEEGSKAAAEAMLSSLPPSMRAAYEEIMAYSDRAWAKIRAQSGPEAQAIMDKVRAAMTGNLRSGDGAFVGPPDPRLPEMTMWDTLKDKAEQVKAKVDAIMGSIADPVGTIRDLAKDIGVAYTPLLKDFDNLQDQIKEIVEDLNEPLKGGGASLPNALAKKLDITLESLTELEDRLGDVMQDWTKSLLKGEASFADFLDRIADLALDFLFSGVFDQLGRTLAQFGTQLFFDPVATINPNVANFDFRGGIPGTTAPPSVPNLFGGGGSDLAFSQPGGGTIVNVYNESGSNVSVERGGGGGMEEVVNIFIRAAASDVLRDGPLGRAVGQRYGGGRASGGRR